MAYRLGTTALAATFALSAMALPTSNDAHSAVLSSRSAEGEPFTCADPSAAAAGKQKLEGYGAQSIDIAIAMLENGCAFSATYPAGNGKPGDAAELGVYRNNWGIIRTYCDDFKGAAEGDALSRGQELHNDVGVATKCQLQLYSTLGADQFYGLQRGGIGNQGAGAEYGKYVGLYNDFCQAHMTDGMAVYYNVPSM